MGLCGKGLTLYQTSTRLVKNESTCRRQNKCDSKTEIYLHGKVENNAGNISILSFSHNVFKSVLF